MAAPHSERYPLGFESPAPRAQTEHFASDHKRRLFPKLFVEQKSYVKEWASSFSDIAPSPSPLAETAPPTFSHVFLDWHNVLESDDREHMARMLSLSATLRSRGVNVTVLSFVGRGTKMHANVLAWFSFPHLRSLFDQLVLVFDKRDLERGKGHIIREWLEQNEGPTVFVDDAVENLQNVRTATSPMSSRVTLVHYTRFSRDSHRLPRGLTSSDPSHLLKLLL